MSAGVQREGQNELKAGKPGVITGTGSSYEEQGPQGLNEPRTILAWWRLRERGSLVHSSYQEGPARLLPLRSIVFVASEVAPYSKTGGLADVVGSLPIALAARGHRVMVVSPRYLDGVNNDRYKGAVDCDKRIDCFCFGGAQQVAFFHEFKNGVDFVRLFPLFPFSPGSWKKETPPPMPVPPSEWKWGWL